MKSPLLYFFIAALFMGTAAFAQKEDKSKYYDSSMIQLYGIVVSSDSLSELPYTTIINKTTKRATISDYYGFFTMVVFPGDTLLFDSYGYLKSSYIVPDTLKADSYSIVHMMIEDGILLPEVTIYPWPSKEDFARYFVEMDPYEDALRRAQRQLSGENLAVAASKIGTDADYAYGNYRMQEQTRLYGIGQVPTVNNLLNPAAWSKFFNSMKKTNKKK
ncbi:MAG: hypothetical protein J0G96_04095 [Flavobacteriia bacterium]|nr:hypothetical protein [Flavobacteriia bacterium]